MRRTENPNSHNHNTLIPGVSDQETHTVLGPKASFEGKLVYQGSLRIDGEFKGSIETNGTLILGENAKVVASINVGCLIVRGFFEGTAVVGDKAELLGSAQFFGEISTKGLMIEEGVVFEGQCRMSKSAGCENKIPALDFAGLELAH